LKAGGGIQAMNANEYLGNKQHVVKGNKASRRLSDPFICFCRGKGVCRSLDGLRHPTDALKRIAEKVVSHVDLDPMTSRQFSHAPPFFQPPPF